MQKTLEILFAKLEDVDPLKVFVEDTIILKKDDLFPEKMIYLLKMEIFIKRIFFINHFNSDCYLKKLISFNFFLVVYKTVTVYVIEICNHNVKSKNMSNKVIIPKPDRKNFMLGIKITESEKNLITKFCINNEVKQAQLLRFALGKIIPQFKK